MSTSGDLTGGNQKPVCTICLEELKPVVEDLQSIPICGHVFHELCIQQWIEFIPAGKKATCPVCKQGCSRTGLTRLYFPSSGDQTQRDDRTRRSGDADELAEEVERLERKVAAQEAMFGNQQEYIKKLDAEISLWKEQAKKEEEEKEAMKKEKQFAEQSLKKKKEELARKSAECTELQEKILGLAKETAALKLVTDLNLGEEEMAKLASLGNGKNTKDAVDILKKSLIIRNKRYKELMAQCNDLGRSYARESKKLEKTKEQKRKMKMRLLDLEKILEEKQNEPLRNLKSSYKGQAQKPVELPVNPNLKSFSNNRPDSLKRTFSHYEVQNDSTSVPYQECSRVRDFMPDISFRDEDGLNLSPDVREHETPYSDIYESSKDAHQAEVLRNKQDSLTCDHIIKDLSGRAVIKMATCDKLVSERVATNAMQTASSIQATETLPIDKISKQAPLTAVRNVQTDDRTTYSGDLSVPGGLFAPESATKSIGKWSRSSSLKVQTSANNGGLISVGADGRGGKVKVLRRQDNLSDRKVTTLPKKQKLGVKQGGQFNIEHFFGKTRS